MEARTDFLTVSELTGRIKRLLESNFGGNVLVKGEISGFKTSSAGHLYFDLKDEGAVLRTVVFAQTRKQYASAIRFFNARYGAGSAWPADLLIVGRGGGSMEDLWCFNEEEVVRAVAESKIPVISSVGHETDTTLCDFAATRRAATPSVAAELAVPRKADLVAVVEKHARSLRVLMQQRFESLSNQLERLCASPCLKYPERMMEIPARRVDQLEMRLNHATAGMVSCGRQRLTELIGRYEVVRGRVAVQTRAALDARCVRMQNAVAHIVERARTRLDDLTNKLTLLNPLAILDRGYSVTFAQDGRVLTSPEGVYDGETLTTRLAGGELRSKAVCGHRCPARM